MTKPIEGRATEIQPQVDDAHRAILNILGLNSFDFAHDLRHLSQLRTLQAYIYGGIDMTPNDSQLAAQINLRVANLGDFLSWGAVQALAETTSTRAGILQASCARSIIPSEQLIMAAGTLAWQQPELSVDKMALLLMGQKLAPPLDTQGMPDIEKFAIMLAAAELPNLEDSFRARALGFSPSQTDISSGQPSRIVHTQTAEDYLFYAAYVRKAITFWQESIKRRVEQTDDPQTPFVEMTVGQVEQEIAHVKQIDRSSKLSGLKIALIGTGVLSMTTASYNKRREIGRNAVFNASNIATRMR